VVLSVPFKWQDAKFIRLLERPARGLRRAVRNPRQEGDCGVTGTSTRYASGACYDLSTRVVAIGIGVSVEMDLTDILLDDV
jgi:hypothetical protein